MTPAAQTKWEIGDIGVGPKERPQVATLSPGGAAERDGLKVGDVLRSSWGYDQTNVDYYEVVELVGLYWHFVDLVWIFLFPLLYLF